MSLKLRDQMIADDSIGSGNSIKMKHPSPYARTKVIFKDEFGRLLGEEENQVVLGGSMFTACKVWDITNPFAVKDLYGAVNNTDTTSDLKSTSIRNTYVTLFGIGRGGTTSNLVNDVMFKECSPVEIIPFRAIEGGSTLSDEDISRYWFKKVKDGYTNYYLKTFEELPTVNVLNKNAADEYEDGTVVDPSEFYKLGDDENPDIEVFVEMHLKITKKDVREYTQINGNTEDCLVNEIALFTGERDASLDTNPDNDYKNVYMFSKLNIPNEFLTLKKDIHIYYRVYLA